MRTAIASAAVVAMFMMVGCATAPNSQAERRGLIAEADATVSSMTAKDPSLQRLLDRSPGYAVFPNIGAAGAIVGGAYGRGVLFERGRPAGFTELNQGSLGALIGGQTYSQIMVFENEAALNRIKAGNFDVGAEASAVALSAGIADAAQFEDGVAIFQLPKGGLMASAAVNGQKINFQPMDNLSSDESSGEAVTAGSSESAYTVDRDLDSNDQLRLRTERIEDNANGASDDAESATHRTEQRIEQRLQQRSDESSGQ
jgi:lipid-binding SYLF domain-containing protein